MQNSANLNERATKQLALRTLSHTLPISIAERLRDFAFEHRLSESVILEHALKNFLERDTEEKLVAELRAAGAGLRRKTA